MVGPVPMLACVSAHTHTHSSDNNPSLPDWAVYEALKTTFIPGYSAYPVNSNPPPLDPSIAAGIAPENESQVRLAGRYAMCSAAGMSTAAVITNPLEVVRTRWQTSGGYMTVSTPNGDMTKKATLPGLIQQIWKQAGWRGFMRGAGMRVLYYVGYLRHWDPLCTTKFLYSPSTRRFLLTCVYVYIIPVHMLNSRSGYFYDNV